jgi:hypothetical protein
MTIQEIKVGVWFISSKVPGNYYYITQVHTGIFYCEGYSENGVSHEITYNCDFEGLDTYTIISDEEVTNIKALMI